MKKFLCYDTNDAASGKINVSANGVLKPSSTVPSTNGAAYQQLVTDGEGGVKWEDRLAYEDKEIIPALNIVWDGNTEGLENANPDPSGTPIYKMSDVIPPDEQIRTLVWTIYESSEVKYASNILETAPSYNNGDYFVWSDYGLVITKKDNVTIPGSLLSRNPVTIADKGIYLPVASTLVGDSVEVAGVKPIDQKFLPETPVFTVQTKGNNKYLHDTKGERMTLEQAKSIGLNFVIQNEYREGSIIKPISVVYGPVNARFYAMELSDAVGDGLTVKFNTYYAGEDVEVAV